MPLLGVAANISANMSASRFLLAIKLNSGVEACWTAIKLLAVVLVLCRAPNAWLHLLEEALQGRSIFEVSAIIYLLTFIFAISSFFITSFLSSPLVRVSLVALTMIPYGLDQIYTKITGHHLNHLYMRLLWVERSAVRDGYEFYLPLILETCVWLIPLTLILMLPPPKAVSLGMKGGALSGAALLLTFGVISNDQRVISAFPPPFVFPVAIGKIMTDTGPAKNISGEVLQSPAITAPVRHIVLIVDESVRGDVLQLNRPDLDNTPYLVNQKLINYGVAVSGANCSFASRVMLRFGLRRSDFGDSGIKDIYNRPSVWKYATSAGYRTTIIEGREGQRVFYMQGNEARFINNYVEVSESAPNYRDVMIAARLKKELQDPRPSFILVNKFGTHYPYETAYPPVYDGAHKKMVTKREGVNGKFRDRNELEDQAEFARERDELRVAYGNALHWSVDGFFNKLLEGMDLRNVLIIYTSDHGQSLMDGGQRLSHCSDGIAQVGEGLVPLLATTGVPEINAALTKAAALGKNQYSHFEIFPTLLRSMGYQKNWVAAEYGGSLFDSPTAGARQFLATGHSGWSSWIDSHTWRTVD